MHACNALHSDYTGSFRVAWLKRTSHHPWLKRTSHHPGHMHRTVSLCLTRCLHVEIVPKCRHKISLVDLKLDAACPLAVLLLFGTSSLLQAAIISPAVKEQQAGRLPQRLLHLQSPKSCTWDWTSAPLEPVPFALMVRRSVSSCNLI